MYEILVNTDGFTLLLGLKKVVSENFHLKVNERYIKTGPAENSRKKHIQQL